MLFELSSIYKPKSAGGWNLIDIKLWNKATVMKLLWALAFKSDKLWVRWVNAYYIKRGNVFSVAISSNTSWLLRNIVESRSSLTDLGGWGSVLKKDQFSIKKVLKLYPNLQEFLQAFSLSGL